MKSRAFLPFFASISLAALALSISADLTAQDKKSAKKDEKKVESKKEGKKAEPKKEEKPAIPLATIKAHGDWVNQVVFSPDGKLLASAGRDRVVKVWDLSSKKEIKSFKGLPENVKTILFLPSNRLAAATGKWNKEKKLWEGEIKIWDLQSGKGISIKGHSDTIEALAASANGAMLASASEDQTIKIWDVSGKELKTLKGHTDQVLGVAFSRAGKLASASKDKTVKVWDLATGKAVMTLKFVKDQPIAKKPSPPEKKVEKKAEKKADKKNAKKVAAKKDMKQAPPPDTGREATCVAFSPDGSRLAGANLDGVVKVWDTATGKELLTLNASDGLWSLVFSPDGQRLAGAGWDKHIHIWDAATGKELTSLLAHENTITSLAFSPDGQRLVSGSLDQTIKIWDPAKKK
jgi:WD40 repeat protein